MKTKLLLILFFVSQLIQSQVRVGVKLGLLATDVNVKAATSLNELEIPTARKLNYSGGITLEYEFLQNLMGIRTGIEYAQKGYNVDLDKMKQLYNDIKNINGDWSVALQYLELPVNMYYKLGPVSINMGPYLGYALGGLEKYDFDVLYNDGTSEVISGSEDLVPVNGEVDADLANLENEDTPLIKYFNQLDMGINLGLGFNLKDIQINVQYQQGLTNLTPDLINEPDFDPADLISKNNVLSVELIYYFRLGKKGGYRTLTPNRN